MVQIILHLDYNRDKFIKDLSKELNTSKHDAVLYCIDELSKQVVEEDKKNMTEEELKDLKITGGPE